MVNVNDLGYVEVSITIEPRYLEHLHTPFSWQNLLIAEIYVSSSWLIALLTTVWPYLAVTLPKSANHSCSSVSRAS